MARGRLYLVPTPLDFGCDTTAPVTEVLPAATIAAAAGITHWICENAKSARAFLKRIGEVRPLAATLQEQAIEELPRAVHKKGDHAPASFDARPLLQAALAGHDVGLLSEAGMPAVADPGSSVVRAAHDLAAVRVRFRALSREEIEAYLHKEQPYDCAGSAKSEGLGIALLEAIDKTPRVLIREVGLDDGTIEKR
jgi:16S rRNA C1402 (ribose-2'-O) methylase RsmI